MDEHKDSLAGVRSIYASRFKEINERKDKILDELKRMNINPYGDGIPVRYIELQNNLRGVEDEIRETREWYTLNVFESLAAYTTALDSKMTSLNEATERLIQSSDNQIVVTARLEESSRRLTGALLILTAALAFFAAQSIFLQVYTDLGYPGNLAFFYSEIGVVVFGFIIVVAIYASRPKSKSHGASPI